MKADLLFLFRVSQFVSQYQRLQCGKVTLQSVSSFKAFTGLKTMGLASGKKIFWNKVAASRKLENGSVMSLPRLLLVWVEEGELNSICLVCHCFN